MAVLNALTTTTSLTNTIKSYYDRVILETLDPSLVYYQFGMKKPLPKGEGTSVVWNRPLKLSLGLILSEGTPTSIGHALSTAKISAVIRQYGGFTPISDLVDMTSIADVMVMAAQRLGAQAGQTIERVIINENFITFLPTTGNSAHHFFKTGSGVEEVWGSVSGVSTVAFGSPISTVSSGATLAVSDIRHAVYSLKSMAVTPYEGNDYVAIVPTESAEDIAGDSTWIGFHQYTTIGVDNLYRGEIGKVYGCRVVETPNGPAVKAFGLIYSSTTSGVAYGTVVMGKGFYGVTELDGGIKTYISQGATKSDPLNQTTTYGWKASFATKLLNASCGAVIWAGSNDSITAFAESASSGLRWEAPGSY